LIKFLEEDPQKRITAKDALNHHWFINFTSRSIENKKTKKLKQDDKMSSLLTILECSEISEKDIEVHRLSK
jgi:serine/threonine protein kinase